MSWRRLWLPDVLCLVPAFLLFSSSSCEMPATETHHSNRLDALRFTVCSLLSVIILFWSFLGVITCKFLYGHAHFFSLQRRKRDVYNTSYDLRVCLPA